MIKLKTSKYIKTIVYVIFAFVLLNHVPVGAQNVTDASLLDGINLFYSARFEQAIQIFREKIIANTLNDENLFAAHLYLAFSLKRQNADQELIKLHLKNAIKAKPDNTLDPNKFPPDLYDIFINAREQLLGNLVIITEPLQSAVILIEPKKSKIKNKYSPATFSNLFQGPYEVVITKDGYLSQTGLMEVRPGMTDTLVVHLKERQNQLLKKWWTWGSGLALTTAFVIYKAVSGDEASETPAATPLPSPPGRPD